MPSDILQLPHVRPSEVIGELIGKHFSYCTVTKAFLQTINFVQHSSNSKRRAKCLARLQAIKKDNFSASISNCHFKSDTFVILLVAPYRKLDAGYV